MGIREKLKKYLGKSKNIIAIGLDFELSALGGELIGGISGTFSSKTIKMYTFGANGTPDHYIFSKALTNWSFSDSIIGGSMVGIALTDYLYNAWALKSGLENRVTKYLKYIRDASVYGTVGMIGIKIYEGLRAFWNTTTYYFDYSKPNGVLTETLHPSIHTHGTWGYSNPIIGGILIGISGVGLVYTGLKLYDIHKENKK